MKKNFFLIGIFIAIIAMQNKETIRIVNSDITFTKSSETKATSDCSTSGCHGCKKESVFIEYKNKL